MNIDSNYNYQTNQIPQRTNFTAVPKANYKLFKNTGKAVIYELEKSDIPFLEKIKANIVQFFQKHQITDEAKQEIFEDSLDASLNILKDSEKLGKKAKIYFAVAEKQPCGLIVGNAAKVDKKGKLVYSSRKNHGSKETELDFLSACHPEYKGTGKALVNEYLIGTKEAGFKDVYVRSEVPQYSGAVDFYSKNGFKSLTGEKQKLDLKKGDNSYVGGDYFDPNDLILPMKATPKRVNETIKETSKAMERREYPVKYSYDLSDIVNV